MIARICVSFYYLTFQFPSLSLASLFPSAKLLGSCIASTGLLWAAKLSLVDWQVVGLGVAVFATHVMLIKEEVLRGWREVLKAKSS
mmetsp:Transcript_10666/g.20716  ORF Transcript_10666/g.20716 Transcript_10666/m.20716 type:complete len:86 (+) Transcript_10666:4678-4935(+)